MLRCFLQLLLFYSRCYVYVRYYFYQHIEGIHCPLQSAMKKIEKADTCLFIADTTSNAGANVNYRSKKTFLQFPFRPNVEIQILNSNENRINIPVHFNVLSLWYRATRIEKMASICRGKFISPSYIKLFRNRHQYSTSTFNCSVF